MTDRSKLEHVYLLYEQSPTGPDLLKSVHRTLNGARAAKKALNLDEADQDRWAIIVNKDVQR